MKCDCNNYLDVYFSRVFHRGENVAEVAKNTGERSFDYWLSSSIHTVKDLSVERGLYFSGIILTNKDKEHQKIMFLNVANNIPLVIGDIINWVNDGVLEKWIIFQKEKKVNGTYQTFLIVRCNYLIKWVDEEGHVQSSWCFFSSSMDSKIKDNFRTWHSLKVIGDMLRNKHVKSVELLGTPNTFLATTQFQKEINVNATKVKKIKRLRYAVRLSLL